MSDGNGSLKFSIPLLVIGIFVNKWTLALFAGDDQISDFFGILIFFSFQSVFLLFGFYFLLAPLRGSLRRVFNAAIVLVSLLFSASLLEIAIRQLPNYARYLPGPPAV